MTRHLIRRYSTRTFVDQWFQTIQSTNRSEQFYRYIQQIQQIDSNLQRRLVNDIIQRWVDEYPQKDIRWTVDRSNQSSHSTFKDIFNKAIQYGDALMENPIKLSLGNNILVVLPWISEERLIIELTCLQRNLFYHWLFDREKFRDILRLFAIDCIITDLEHLEWIHQSTYNALRPLKKLLITKNESVRQPVLPVGWIRLNDHLSSIENSSSRSDQFFHQQSLSYLVNAYWLNRFRAPQLIWMKEMNKSLSPWLLGSTLFFRQTNDDMSMLMKTLETYPIDTIYGSDKDYRIIDRDYPLISSHLQQLFSIDSISNAQVKERWMKMTNLSIDDEREEIEDDRIVVSFPSMFVRNQFHFLSSK